MIPRFLDAGETALVVEFASRIDPAARDAVLALDARLTADPPTGLIETVPTYRSLMAHYDPLRIDRASLIGRIQTLLNVPTDTEAKGVLWRIPACYDPELAEDLPELALQLGKSPAEVAALHASGEYFVAMIGFAPGWAYLDGLPEALAVPRRASPRARIPENSLIIAGGLAIISTMPMPSGWHIIGRTAESLFRADRDPPFLCAPGDRIRFASVSRDEHEALLARGASGEIIAERLPA